MYNNLDIKCNREKCDKIVKISDLVGHEATCFKVLCKNADVCAGEVSKTDFLKYHDFIEIDLKWFALQLAC
jgi:hypothetical protein